MTGRGGWDTNEKWVVSKIEDCEAAQEKQDEINAKQSQWNHATDSRIDRIQFRLGVVSAAIGALFATAAENIGKVAKAIISVIIP